MRATPALVVIASCISAISAAAQGNVGWSITLAMTRDTGSAGPPVLTVTRERIAPRMMRLEVERGSAPSPMSDRYMLFRTGDSSVTTVSPERRIAMTMSTPHVSTGVSLISRSVTSMLTDLGPGDAILGHATRHYRRVSLGTVTESIVGRRCTVRVNTTSDYWIASDVELGDVAVTLMQRIIPGFGDAVAKLAASTRDAMPRGTPLRETRRDVLRDGPGRTRTLTSTVEYRELSHGVIPDSIFDIPVDYQRMTVSGLARVSTSAALDSIRRAVGERLASRICEGG